MNKIYQLIKMYLSFSISNSVTQEEWNKVYKKTLYLADKLNLADWSKFYYKGIKKEVRTNKKRLSSKEFKELEVKEPTKYKDSLFHKVFGAEDKRSARWHLELYNALSGKNHNENLHKKCKPLYDY